MTKISSLEGCCMALLLWLLRARVFVISFLYGRKLPESLLYGTASYWVFPHPRARKTFKKISPNNNLGYLESLLKEEKCAPESRFISAG